MLYSKTTDEIIRELNDFIAKAKETANSARKDGVPEYKSFWNTIADATDAFANKAKDVLERIATIAERPDEIANRFAIIRVIQDIAVQSNALQFNVRLTVSRDQPERIHAHEPFRLRRILMCYAILKTKRCSMGYRRLKRAFPKLSAFSKRL